MNIAVFGTVGAGKSTFCEALKNKLGYTLFIEPLEKNPYFDDYYKEMQKYCFQMQIFMLTSRVNALYKYNEWNNTIFDRSIIEDPVFVRVQKRMNIFTERDFNTYSDFYENVIKRTIDDKLKIDKIIYLKVSTDTALRRIKERGRQSEIDTPREYWEILNEEYENLYQELKDKYDFFVIEADHDNLDDKVESFLNSIK